MSDPAITGFVLAGGQSTRMGTDKAALPWADTTLLEHMTGLLSGVASTVRIVGRDELPDIEPGRGPLEGIRTALTSTTTEHNLITAVDLPFLDPRFLQHLARRLRFTAKDLLVCKIEGHVPLCIGARRRLLRHLKGYMAAGGGSIHAFSACVEHEEISDEELHRAAFGPEIFRNINTREDYEQAQNS